MGAFDRALADFDRALQLDPRSALALTERASTYRAKGELDHAIADYDRALRLDENSTTAYDGRATVYLGKGDLDKALADFNEAVRTRSEIGRISRRSRSRLSGAR